MHDTFILNQLVLRFPSDRGCEAAVKFEFYYRLELESLLDPYVASQDQRLQFEEAEDIVDASTFAAQKTFNNKQEKRKLSRAVKNLSKPATRLAPIQSGTISKYQEAAKAAIIPDTAQSSKRKRVDDFDHSRPSKRKPKSSESK